MTSLEVVIAVAKAIIEDLERINNAYLDGLLTAEEAMKNLDIMIDGMEIIVAMLSLGVIVEA